MRRTRRNTTAALTAAVFMLGTVACGGDEPQPEPAEPTSSLSESTTPPVSSTWKKKYTKKQLAGYEDALERWEAYEARSEPIWSKGKATDAAADMFKEYFPSPFWQGQYKTLASYEQVDVHIDGTPGIYWSKAKRITKNGLSVEINQCVDYAEIKVTQRGKPAKQVAWQQKPNLRTIKLSKPKGYDWLIYGITDASTGKARPCKP